MGVEEIDISIHDADNDSDQHGHRRSSSPSVVFGPHTRTFSTRTGISSPEWHPGVKEWLVLTCVSISVMLDGYNSTAIIPLIPKFSMIFDEPLEISFWLSTAYLLPNAASQSFFTMLSAKIGHGPFFLAAVLIATIGGGIGAGATDLATLVASRFIQGVGGGGAMALSLQIITELIPPSHQHQFTNYALRANTAGTMLGPVMGGLLGEHIAWKWVFYFSFIFSAPAMLVIPFAMDLKGNKEKYSRQRLRAMDWLGSLLTFLGVGLVLVGISWGGTRVSWDDAWTVVPIATGGGLMVVFVLSKALSAGGAIVTGTDATWRTRIHMWSVQVGGFVQGVLISAHFHILPLYIAQTHSLGPTATGLSLLTLSGPTLPMLYLENKILRLRSDLHLSPWIIRLGWILSILSTGCFVLLDASTATQGWVFAFLAAGISHALLTQGYLAILQHKQPKGPPSHFPGLAAAPDRVIYHNYGNETFGYDASATARRRTNGFIASPISDKRLMYTLLYTWGTCIAVPVACTILLNRISTDSDVRDMVASGLDDAASILVLDGGQLLSGREDLVTGVTLWGMRDLWRIWTGVGAVGVLSSLFLK